MGFSELKNCRIRLVVDEMVGVLLHLGVLGSSDFMLIFAFNKNHLAVLHMETATYTTTLVKTYRRLFSCLMFYN